MIHSHYFLKSIVLTGALWATAPGADAGTLASSGKEAPATAIEAAEEEEGLFGGIGVEWSIGYDTHYIFRGELLQKNTPWTQFSWDLSLSDSLSLNVTPWFLLDADGEYNEFDLEASLTLAAGGFGWSLGYSGYYYPRGALGGGEGIDDEQEMWGLVSREFGGFTASVLGAYNFTREAWYFEAALEYEVEVTESFSLTPSATVGWDVDYYYNEGANWNHVTLQLTASFALTPWCRLEPYVAANFPFGSLDYADDDIFGGVALVVVF